jgi:hypothetical protein
LIISTELGLGRDSDGGTGCESREGGPSRIGISIH